MCHDLLRYASHRSRSLTPRVFSPRSHRSLQRLPVVTYRHCSTAFKSEDEKSAANSDPSASGSVRTVRTGGAGNAGGATNAVRAGCPVLTRSAQPLVGLTLKSCAADEKLLNFYRLKGRSADSRCKHTPHM